MQPVAEPKVTFVTIFALHVRKFTQKNAIFGPETFGMITSEMALKQQLSNGASKLKVHNQNEQN